MKSLNCEKLDNSVLSNHESSNYYKMTSECKLESERILRRSPNHQLNNHNVSNQKL